MVSIWLLRVSTEAHEPIQAVLILALVVHPLLGYAAAAGGGHYDIIAGPPIGGGGAGLSVCLLESQNDALDFIKVTACRQRIVQDGPYHPIGINDKYRPHRLRIGLARLDHAELVGNLYAYILDQRKVYI